MSAGNDDGVVVVGVVGKPFGIRGEVYVFPDPDLGDEFGVRGHYRAVGGGKPAAELRVVTSRIHRGRRIVRFEGVEDRDAAEALRGTVLGVPRAQAAPGEDAVWTADLLGREVVDDEGAVVGVVEGALDGTAHDYLVIARPDGGELLIPAVPELVDVDADPIVVQAIPGLLDLTTAPRPSSSDPSAAEGPSEEDAR